MNKDAEFIKRPLHLIVKKVVCETESLEAGFTTRYVLKYILDSAFLQICGALEQKIKCICWELVNNSHAQRQEFFEKGLRGYSSLQDKENKLKMICKEIEDISKEKIIFNESVFWENESVFLFNNSVFSKYFNREYAFFLSLREELGYLLKDECFRNDVQSGKSNAKIFSNNKLRDIYSKFIYNYRNSIAHNTKSTINYLPDFEELKEDDYKYENPFLRFALILFVDMAFIEVFEQYEQCLENK